MSVVKMLADYKHVAVLNDDCVSQEEKQEIYERWSSEYDQARITHAAQPMHGCMGAVGAFNKKVIDKIIIDRTDFGDSISVKYSAPKKCSDAICSYVLRNRECMSVLDIGAGTGLMGAELYKQGFRIIDAVDPSKSMLDKAKQKGVYRKFFCNFMTSEPSAFIKSDSYDVVTSCGCLNPGHLPYDVIIEMIRITKPGGIVCIGCRTEYVRDVPEFAKFFPLCDQLEREGKWKKEEVTVYDGYLINVEGMVIVYRVI